MRLKIFGLAALAVPLQRFHSSGHATALTGPLCHPPRPSSGTEVSTERINIAMDLARVMAT